jgi:hypothetical protein
MSRVRSDRKPAYENEVCREAGLMMTCNGCDRIIWVDENYVEAYAKSRGYCRECYQEQIEGRTL